jgi:hypothetical protein
VRSFSLLLPGLSFPPRFEGCRDKDIVEGNSSRGWSSVLSTVDGNRHLSELFDGNQQLEWPVSMRIGSISPGSSSRKPQLEMYVFGKSGILCLRVVSPPPWGSSPRSLPTGPPLSPVSSIGASPRLEPEMRKLLEEFAGEEDRTTSQMARILLRDILAAKWKKIKKPEKGGRSG